MNRPKEKDGIIIAFRRTGSTNESIRTRLHGLEENAIYELYYEDYGLRIRKTGRELNEVFELSIPQKPASLLVSYHIVEK